MQILFIKYDNKNTMEEIYLCLSKLFLQRKIWKSSHFYSNMDIIGANFPQLSRIVFSPVVRKSGYIRRLTTNPFRSVRASWHQSDVRLDADYGISQNIGDPLKYFRNEESSARPESFRTSICCDRSSTTVRSIRLYVIYLRYIVPLYF